MTTAPQNTAPETEQSSYALNLIEKKEEAPGVISFLFLSHDLNTWKAGQYLHYYLEHEADERGRERYFTIASAPYEGIIMLTTRFSEKSSSFKKVLRELQRGQTIYADGLDGDFTADDPQQDRVFIAGGIGITPYRAIVLDLVRRGQLVNSALLYANHDEKFPFMPELEHVARRHLNFNIQYVIGPKHIGEDDVLRAAANMHQPVYYISGPEPMVESYSKMLETMGIPEQRIKSDYFPGYEWS